MCYSLWYNAPTMLPAGSLEAELPGHRSTTSWVHYTTSCNTQSSAPEDGRDHRPKHVALIGIINKPLLLHLVGVYVIYIGKTFTDRQETYCQDLHYLTFKNTQIHKIRNVYTFPMKYTNCVYPYLKVTRPVFCLSVFLFCVLLEIQTQSLFNLLLKIAK